MTRRELLPREVPVPRLQVLLPVFVLTAAFASSARSDLVPYLNPPAGAPPPKPVTTAGIPDSQPIRLPEPSSVMLLVLVETAFAVGQFLRERHGSASGNLSGSVHGGVAC